MPNLIWLDDYNTGNEKIDEQHRYLFDLANHILNPENDYQTTHHAFLVLFHDIRQHFQDEEQLMEQSAFPQAEEHKKEHELLLSELEQISQEIIRGEMNADSIIAFMRHWLFDHFLQKDMNLGKTCKPHTSPAMSQSF